MLSAAKVQIIYGIMTIKRKMCFDYLEVSRNICIFADKLTC